ncbi:hypothetical protein DFP72DRAFT_867632 [Ephemerocybe angulata]|uniref:Uncharacterized protein n=1 Tax=Ephemerocybe angulata TaxID=980116 RepID=A0A8H6IJ19_9AGAR|nr:hypothetical protein DFP72DRAFT_867632 [Tulosesus angulatus]
MGILRTGVDATPTYRGPRHHQHRDEASLLLPPFVLSNSFTLLFLALRSRFCPFRLYIVLIDSTFLSCSLALFFLPYHPLVLLQCII